jgi:hypothetical protein
MQPLDARGRKCAAGLVTFLIAFGVVNAGISVLRPSYRTDYSGSVRMVNVDVPVNTAVAVNMPR